MITHLSLWILDYKITQIQNYPSTNEKDYTKTHSPRLSSSFWIRSLTIPSACWRTIMASSSPQLSSRTLSMASRRSPGSRVPILLQKTISHQFFFLSKKVYQMNWFNVLYWWFTCVQYYLSVSQRWSKVFLASCSLQTRIYL